MDNEAVAVKLAEVDSRARSNTRRIDKLEQSDTVLTKLATSVEVMATELKTIAESVNRLDGKVTELEAEPGERWKSIVEKTIWAVVGGVIVYVFAQFGIS